MEKWVKQVRLLLAKAKGGAASQSKDFSGFEAANDDGVASPPIDLSDADVDGTLTRIDRALLISDIVRIAADDGWDSTVASELRARGIPSLAHASDDYLIDLFVYLDYELRLEAV